VKKRNINGGTTLQCDECSVKNLLDSIGCANFKFDASRMGNEVFVVEARFVFLQPRELSSEFNKLGAIEICRRFDTKWERRDSDRG
jgi:hypothetical protein